MDNKNQVIEFLADEEDIPAMIEEMRNIAESFQAKVEEVESLCESEEYEKAYEDSAESVLKMIKQRDESMYWKIDKLLRTIFKKMNTRIPWNVLRQFIVTANTEICMSYMEYGEYNRKHDLDISVGDIVSCCYERHLPGEIVGATRMAVVCKKEQGNQVYLVPIVRRKSGDFRILISGDDLICGNLFRSNNYLMLKMGRYVNRKRILGVIGKVTPEFLQKVLHQLPAAFDFTDTIQNNDVHTDYRKEGGNAVDESVVIQAEDSEAAKAVAKEAENTANFEKVVEIEERNHTSEETTEAIAIVAPSKKATDKKMSLTEATLLEVIGCALNKLDISKELEEQIDFFLTEIGMTTEKTMKNAFIAACNITKINYPNVALEVYKMCQDQKEDENTIKVKLKAEFKDWALLQPVLLAKCPRVSLMNVLRIFAKRFAN